MRLICMSFDGDFVTEGRDFITADEAWERSSDMGSRWFFYPFHFVTTESGKTISDAYGPLEFLRGHRVKTAANLFAKLAALPEAQDMDAEQFAWFIACANPEAILEETHRGD